MGNDETYRIRVAPSDTGWYWAVGTPNSNDHGMDAVWGRGTTRTRWGGVLSARLRLRKLARDRRRREKALTLDVPAR